MLIYALQRYKGESGNYLFDSIYIARADKLSTKQLLDGTVGNKDGYQTAEIAESMGKGYQCMIDAGHAHFFDSVFGSSCRVVFQHYSPTPGEYCSPSVGFLTDRVDPEQLVWGANLVVSLGKRLAKAQGVHSVTASNAVRVFNSCKPDALLSVLEGMKAQFVTLYRSEQLPSMWVASPKRDLASLVVGAGF